MNPDRLLDGLDPAQRLAVTTDAQPLAILAGAGSGKTRVLTRRIAHRCATGTADARHVLAVTFTRKAAAELDGRLRKMGLRDLPAAGTFHALAYAQLRTIWASEQKAAPTLLDRKGRILGRILGNTKRVRPADLAAEIEWAKARLVAPDGYAAAAAAARRRPPVDPERVAGWYLRYEQEKRKRGLVDFDDLLLLCAARLERDPSFAAAQRWRFRHLFVDEYQDVNPLQDRLLRAWMGDRTDLCVVGDPNQAIYSWNGADASFLLDFAEHHPGAEVVELSDSYRSTPQVLAVASAIIGGRPIGAHRADGPPPVVVGYQSDVDEANGVARAVRDNHRPGRPWSSQAVLVRTNAQTTLFAEAFRKASIPYRVRGANRFLDEPDVGDLLQRFDRLSEPLVTTINDLEESVARQRAELLGAYGEDADGEDGRHELPDTAVGRRIDAFEQVVRLGRELLAMESGARTDSFPNWLRAVLLDDGPASADAVTIASFHSAKGLEWDVVHIAGCEDGYVPISHARTAEARAEEERLFYVAVTRAAEVLRCSWAKQRTFTTDPVDRVPSPLLTKVRDAIGHLERGGRAAADSSAALAQTRERLSAGAEVRPDAGDVLAVTNAISADLRSWRSEQARKAGVRPTVVLSDRALHAVASARPTTDDDLDGLAGLGRLARRQHGARLLEIVGSHVGSGSVPR
ncbi:MAG: ATP-dependent DNA helicase UvrD2 [Acidimicrobiales bacterium]|nr:ATP-dependent DNA helicase UvrD2 [Acidimicrobiales bacterium]